MLCFILISLPAFLYQKIKFSHLSQDLTNPNFDFLELVFNKTLYLTSISDLNIGSFLLAKNFYSTVIISFLILLFYRVYIKKISKISDENNYKNLEFFRAVLKITIYLIFVSLLFALIVTSKGDNSDYLITLIFVFLSYSFLPLNILITSFIKASLLLFVLFLFHKKRVGFNKVFNNTLRIINKIFVINVIILIPLFYDIFYQYLLHFGFIGTSSIAIKAQTYFLFYLNILFTITFWPAIFVLLLNESFSIKKLLSENFRFIYKNLFRNLIFLIIGLTLFVIPNLVNSSLIYNTGYFDYLRFIINNLHLIIELFFAVIFYIAYFKFVIDYSELEK